MQEHSFKDLSDFAAWASERYSPEDTDIALFSRLAVVKFKIWDGKPRGECAWGKVYVPDEKLAKDIKSGSFWLCELRPADNRTFKGTPFRRVDANFVLELRPDLAEGIAASVNASGGGALDSLVKIQAETLAEKLSADRIAAVNAEKAELVSALDEAERSIADLEARLASVSSDLEAVRAENDSLESKLSDMETRAERMRSANAELVEMTRSGRIPLDRMPEPVQGPGHAPVVMRNGKNGLTSDCFTEPLYKVRLTADRTMIVITPTPQGNIPCDDNTLRIDGLSSVCNYEGNVRMNAAWLIGDEGSLVVLLH